MKRVALSELISCPASSVFVSGLRIVFISSKAHKGQDFARRWLGIWWSKPLKSANRAPTGWHLSGGSLFLVEFLQSSTRWFRRPGTDPYLHGYHSTNFCLPWWLPKGACNAGTCSIPAGKTPLRIPMSRESSAGWPSQVEQLDMTERSWRPSDTFFFFCYLLPRTERELSIKWVSSVLVPRIITIHRYM